MISSLLSLLCLGMLGKWFFSGILKEHFEFSFITTPLLTFAYFLTATAITIFLFPAFALDLFTPITLPAILSLVIVLAVGPALYVYARRHHVRPVHIPHLEFLSLRRPFLFSKVADVLFQQTLIGIALLILSEFFPLVPLLVLFTIVMVVGHVDLYYRMSEDWALYFIITAGLLSAPLAILILFVPGGIYYAIALHMLWYSAGGVVLSLRHHEHGATM